MIHDTVRFVGRSLDRFLSDQPDRDELDPDVEIRDHDTPQRGEYRGHDGFPRWLEESGSAWAEWSVQPEQFIDAGNRVVATVRPKAEGT
jgi:hypothetical protein